MIDFITGIDWLELWRNVAIALAWCTVIIFIISGLEDLIYDIGGYACRLYRRVKYRKRERLTLDKLREREQQKIAVMIPAWREAEVIGAMLDHLLNKVEYRNYTVFVGTYPNDADTQQVVDTVAAAHRRVVKVVTEQHGPTSKANCLNTVWAALKQFEAANGTNFDIVLLHDAEDTVHPYSLMLFNYLLPRVDVVQLPILPQPTRLYRGVHWTYADEFAENHMKDLIVREMMSGFVPFAGVGMGFSRRALEVLEQRNGGPLFNESSLTEDYHLGKRVSDAELQAVFVNVLLRDDDSPWYAPLCARPGFIANWSFFPMHFRRAVRQKTRWITGISLQEWTMTGWTGNLAVKENLVKDRKVFISTLANLLAYIVVLYVIVAELGEHGYLPFQWLLPIIYKGTLLYTLVLIATGLMLFRMLERVVFVTMVYGILPGLTSLPRLIYGNVLNGYAAFRALFVFLREMRQNRQKEWDKTEHIEGVGLLPADSEMEYTRTTARRYDLQMVKAMLASELIDEIVAGLENIPRDAPAAEQERLVQTLQTHARADEHAVRARVARVAGFLRWPALEPVVVDLLFDAEWVVRANAAHALVKFDDFARWLPDIFRRDDRYASEALIRVIEQDKRVLARVVEALQSAEMVEIKVYLSERSSLLKAHFTAPMVKMPTTSH